MGSINFFKKIAAGISLFALLAVAAPVTVMASSPFDASKEAACQGAQFSNKGSCADAEKDAKRLDGVLELVVNILTAIVGIIAVIMIIVGGLKYVTSSGDPSNVTSAKNTLLYAVIGLIIVGLAQVIVKFVLNKT
jgi:hypothetical protein